MKSLLFIGVFTLFSLPVTVSACSCYTHPAPIEFNGARLVFIGRMLGGTEEISRTDDAGKPHVTEAGQVRFAVEELFKGSKAEEVTIQVDSLRGTSCAYGLKRGERYVVYAFSNPKNEKVLYTGVCSRTKLATNEHAKEDLEFLRNLPPPGTGGNIKGLIYVNNKGGEPQRLANVKVKICNSSGQAIFAFSDKNGEFEVKRLLPDQYILEVELPPNYTIRSTYAGAKVDDRGTASVTFVAYANGKVSGRVVDKEGNIVNSVYLQMIDGSKAVNGRLVGKDGAFEILAVPPGQYLLFMELHSIGETERRPYYYPGTFERDKATLIRLGLGEKKEGVEFTLPPDALVRTIEGEVVWKDGSPAANAQIFLDCPRSSAPDGMVVYSYRYARTDAQGRFRVEAFTGETYMVQASVRKGKTREELVLTYSLPQEISTGGNVEGLKLTLSETGNSKFRCPQ